MSTQAVLTSPYYRIIPRTIRGVMLLTAFFAGTFAFHYYLHDGSTDAIELAEMALFAIALVMTGGLVQQCVSLCKHWKTALRGLSTAEARNQKWGITVSIAVRAMIIVMVPTAFVLQTVWSKFELFFDKLDMNTNFRLHTAALPALWLVVAVACARQYARTPKRRRWWHALIDVLTVCGIATIIAFAVYYALIIVYLVFVAIRGMEFAWGHDTPFLPDADPRILGRLQPAFWTCLWTFLLFVVSVFAWCKYALHARSDNPSTKRKRVYFALAMFATVIYVSLVAWNVFWLLPAGAPLMMSVGPDYSAAAIAANGIPLVLLTTVALALRIAKRRRTGAMAETLAGPATPPRALAMPVCWHERPVLLLCCALATLSSVGAIDMAESLWEWAADNVHTSWNLISLDVMYFAENCAFSMIDIYDVENSLHVTVALILVCFTLAWRGRKKRILAIPVEVPDYGSAAGLSTVWLMMLLLVMATIPQLAIFGFMLWVAPWFL